MQASEVMDSLKDYFVREVLDGREAGLDAETPLIEWGLLNSMEIMKLIRFIEDRYNVTVPGNKVVMANLKDLTALSALVMELALEQGHG